MRFFRPVWAFLLIGQLFIGSAVLWALNPAWDDFLKDYVHQGEVDYARLVSHQAEIKQIFQSFSATPAAEFKDWDKNRRMAYWLNLYNFLVIKTVTEHYPIQPGFSWRRIAYPSNSIQQIADVWKRPVLKVGGKEISLDEIEHKILRAKFKEPRIHFALVCASKGCPVLREEAYDGEQLDRQLDDQVRKFLADPSKFKYDADQRVLYLSPIFKWFKDDFESGGGLIAFINRYQDSAVSEKANIIWLNYDWHLNQRGG